MLADIPPSDVARIDVLKDAAGTSMYGSRGANGVIVITTNRGR
jgi:TonB-dependent SusC/RagA subfamily outer membrane receptor